MTRIARIGERAAATSFESLAESHSRPRSRIALKLLSLGTKL